MLDPDPYLRLMDPDPGGPKTLGPYRSGFGSEHCFEEVPYETSTTCAANSVVEPEPEPEP